MGYESFSLIRWAYKTNNTVAMYQGLLCRGFFFQLWSYYWEHTVYGVNNNCVLRAWNLPCRIPLGFTRRGGGIFDGMINSLLIGSWSSASCWPVHPRNLRSERMQGCLLFSCLPPPPSSLPPLPPPRSSRGLILTGIRYIEQTLQLHASPHHAMVYSYMVHVQALNYYRA